MPHWTSLSHICSSWHWMPSGQESHAGSLSSARTLPGYTQGCALRPALRIPASTSSDVATKLTHGAKVPSTAFLNSDSSNVDDLKAHSATHIPMGDAAPKSPCYSQSQEPETGFSSFDFCSSLKFLCKHAKSPRGHLLRYHFQPFAAGMFFIFLWLLQN